MAKLTLVGTPIGNLEDITIRALRSIFESNIILAEDTRVTSKLKGLLKEKYKTVLDELGINIELKQKFISYRDQNHDRITPEILQLLRDGNNITLVSDAGMPGISDPGYKLVKDVLDAGLEVDVIPGPTAVTAALLLSGLPTDRYMFVGFLPRKKGKISELLSNIQYPVSILFYESPFRVKKTVDILHEILPEETEIALCGEMTKKFQTVYRGSIPEVQEQIAKLTLKGEWVVCLRV